MFFFQIYFSFVTRFVGFSFFFQIYFSFEWFICSQISYSMYIVRWIFFFSDLPFFWLMFCFESLEQLEEYKKGNQNFFFRSSTSSQIYFVFYYFWFSWIFFCKIYLFLFGEFFQIFFSLLTKCVGSRFFSQIYCLMDFFSS